jgi:hypothetical protein
MARRWSHTLGVHIDRDQPPVDVDVDVVLAGTVEEILEEAEGYPVDVVRRLIESEYTGRNRSTLLERLERIAKAEA